MQRQQGASEDPLFAKADSSGIARIEWDASYGWNGSHGIQFNADYNADSFYAKTSDLEGLGDMSAFGGRELNKFSIGGIDYTSIILDQGKKNEMSTWLGGVRVDNNECRETEHVLPDQIFDRTAQANRSGVLTLGGESQ